MYLCIPVNDWYPSLHPHLVENPYICCYLLPSGGRQIITEWQRVPYRLDQNISGIVADWLEDHWEELLSGAVGPDPSRHLQRLIDAMRSRFGGR